jgi:hypothetical protein
VQRINAMFQPVYNCVTKVILHVEKNFEKFLKNPQKVAHSPIREQKNLYTIHHFTPRRDE